MALYAFGFTAFILPHKVVIGGLAGVGTLVYFSTGIPVAITQYLCNLALLAVAYRIVGRRFVVGTIYGATMISVWVACSSRCLTVLWPYTGRWSKARR